MKQTKEEILLKHVGHPALSGLKWKTLAERKEKIYTAMQIYADQECAEKDREIERLRCVNSQLESDRYHAQANLEIAESDHARLKGEYLGTMKGLRVHYVDHTVIQQIDYIIKELEVE